ncbi:hypothetical protein GQX73_g8219 [Xylaria multiplex]|uniref:Uncharacterized protein n=1 Tax=Xylaria multiplex TaxID=323545 RepID=A0A7C8IJN1_9PEZI|nr:hypothetical protein GQX73_g8219 [Xylaria multiplex]
MKVERQTFETLHEARTVHATPPWLTRETQRREQLGEVSGLVQSWSYVLEILLQAVSSPDESSLLDLTVYGGLAFLSYVSSAEYRKPLRSWGDDSREIEREVGRSPEY